MTKQLYRPLSACDCRQLLDVAHHDIDRLLAEHEGFLQLLLLMLDRGHVKAAANVIRERLQ